MGAQLSQLILSNIRNLEPLDLSFGPQFNVFIGENGSGKTSLLEAVHLLGVGRSFRARSVQQIISFGQNQCLVRAKVRAPLDSTASDVWLGVMRGTNGEAQYRVGERAEKSSVELSKMLPVQLIDVNSPLLIEGSPNCRRQFLDWGVFHVEHSFLENWRLMRRALEQRNASLRKKQRPSIAWNESFIKYALEVNEARLRYMQQFRAVFITMLQDVLDISNVELRYHRGWSEDKELGEALSFAENMDLAYGYTNRGPHRADLEILLEGRQLKTVLSRGQTKIFVCIMLLARAKLLEKKIVNVFLIDDLHAELDQGSCRLLVESLNVLGSQVFITGIEKKLINTRLNGYDTRMFHVEQGRITEPGYR